MVVDPVKHRANLRNQQVNYYKIWGKPPNVIDTVVDGMIPDDLWLCDICNDQIELEASERVKKHGFGITPVFQDESYAYCTKCFAKLILNEKQGSLKILVCDCCLDEEVFDTYEKIQGMIMFWLGDVNQQIIEDTGKEATFRPVTEEVFNEVTKETEEE